MFSMGKGKAGIALAFGAAMVAAWFASVGSAQADAVISNGTIALGVNDEGHLNVYDATDVNPRGSYVGVTYLGLGDATSPGCLCEGWGAAANGVSGWASEDLPGISNLTVDSFGSTATTATSVVHLTSLPDLQITQAYAPSVTSALYEDVVTLTNNGAGTLTDIRYTRAMDWDVPPTEFNEYVTIGGTSASALLYSDDNGFAYPDPLDPVSGGIYHRADLGGCGTTTDFVDCGPADHGARFDFGFHDLAPGESLSFSIFYGAAPTEADAFAALAAVGGGLYSLGQSNTVGGPTDGTPATFIFAFGGGEIGAPPVPGGEVPEPATMALLGSGLLGLGLFKRNRKGDD